MPKDLLGNEVKVGDIIVYIGAGIKFAHMLRLSTVEEITKSGISAKIGETRYGKHYSVICRIDQLMVLTPMSNLRYFELSEKIRKGEVGVK